MEKIGLARAGAPLVVLAGAALARADVIYHNDFQQGPLGSEWSSNSHLEPHGTFSRYNGRYSNDEITLRLGAVPPPDGAIGVGFGHVGGTKVIVKGGGGDDGGGDGDGGGGGDGGGDGGGEDGGDGGGSPYVLYTLEFDLYTIDSWDGEGKYGPDVFEVRANGEPIFHETFSNGLKPQSFRPPDIGPMHLGYSSTFKDSIYRDIRVDFTVPESAAQVVLAFEGLGLQGLVDESWGIDNITVSYEIRYGPIPAPATLAAPAAALLLVRRRRGA